MDFNSSMLVKMWKALSLLVLLLFIMSPVEAFSFNDIFDFDALNPSSEIQDIKLLAVQESPEGLSGSIANVNLEIRSGSGRVFLDTYPLSQIDTQISTRFAKDIACKYIEGDCSRYDFIYTIRSDSAIIGGPSAGAALSVITIASLKDMQVRDDIAITGTINSGGTIGPVSGVKYKIDAAAEEGLSKVLVPSGTIVQDNQDGLTYNTSDYGEKVGIEVVEVAELDDALYEFTGNRVVDHETSIDIPEIYSDTMRSVAEDLCSRNDELTDQYESLDPDVSEPFQEIVDNLESAAIQERERADSAMSSESYYAAASHCYGSNINYQNLILIAEDDFDDSIEDDIDSLSDDISDLEDEIDSRELPTLSDFEVYTIMKERIDDAKLFVDNARDAYTREDVQATYRSRAQAEERLYTARVWENFFGLGGERFDIDDDVLASSCTQKISETQEVIQYIGTMVPEQALEGLREEFNSALDSRKDEEYALCISRASRAKANANVFVNTLSMNRDRLSELVDNKLSAARNVIVREQAQNRFPIMGYSYYEYAESLGDDDLQSALLYAEYALELSWLDIYFEESFKSPRIPINFTYITLLAIGFFAGGVVMISLSPRKNTYTSSRRMRRRLRRRLRNSK